METSSTKTLLLVEDDAIIAMTTAKKLEARGYQVKTAFSGEEAVAMVRANPHIELVLMDINLGSGIDGTEAAQIILSERSIPVVFLSGHAEPDVVEKTEKITSYGYVVKGASETILVASIKMAFKLHEAYLQLEKSLAEQRKVDEALNASEHKYRRLVETLQEGICELDQNAVITFVNPHMLSMLGYTSEEMLGYPLFQFMDSQEKEQALRKMEQGCVNANKNCEMQLLRKNGQRLFVRMEVSPLFDEQGRCTGAIAGVQDITESRHARQALEQSEKRFRALAENSQDAFLLLDQVGTILFRGPMVEHLNGFSNEERLGSSIFDLILPEDHAKARRILTEILTQPGGVVTGELHGIRKDGSIWCAEGSVTNLLHDPAVRAIVLNFRDITARVQMEADLRDSEEKFSKAFQHAPLVMTIIRMDDGTFVDINRKAEEISGYRREELIGHTSAKLGWILPADRAHIIAQVRQHGRVERLELPFYRKGSLEPVDCLYSAEAITLNGQDCLLSIIQIMPRRQQAGTAAGTQEKHFLSIFKQSPVMMLISDLEDGHIVEINDQCLNYIGFTRAEVVGKSFDELGWECPDGSQHLANMLDANGLVEGMEISLRHKNSPEEIHCLYFGQHIHFQGAKRLLTFIFDITPLHRSEKRYRILLHSGNDAIFINTLTDDGRPGPFVETNQKSCEMLGYDSDELLRMAPLEISAPLETADIEQIVQQLLTEKRAVFELKLRRKDGSMVDAEFSSQFIESTERPLVLSIARDVTENRRAKEALELALQEKSTMLSDLQHRIKNSLALIISLIDLQADYVVGAEALMALAEIRSRVDALTGLYSILYSSKDFQVVQLDHYLQQICASVIASYRKEKQIQLNIQCDAVLVDARKATPFGLILNELMTNALKYAFPSGASGTINVMLQRQGNQLELTVSNDGLSLPEHFSLSSSRGLGLQIMKMLAGQLNGTISHESNQFTTFRVRVPLVKIILYS
jgi:PAS domain S-box-containing protein